jgi:hypothetical protein
LFKNNIFSRKSLISTIKNKSKQPFEEKTKFRKIGGKNPSTGKNK